MMKTLTEAEFFYIDICNNVLLLSLVVNKDLFLTCILASQFGMYPRWLIYC